MTVIDTENVAKFWKCILDNESDEVAAMLTTNHQCLDLFNEVFDQNIRLTQSG